MICLAFWVMDTLRCLAGSMSFPEFLVMVIFAIVAAGFVLTVAAIIVFEILDGLFFRPQSTLKALVEFGYFALAISGVVYLLYLFYLYCGGATI